MANIGKLKNPSARSLARVKKLARDYDKLRAEAEWYYGTWSPWHSVFLLELARLEAKGKYPKSAKTAHERSLVSVAEGHGFASNNEHTLVECMVEEVSKRLVSRAASVLKEIRPSEATVAYETAWSMATCTHALQSKYLRGPATLGIGFFNQLLYQTSPERAITPVSRLSTRRRVRVARELLKKMSEHELREVLAKEIMPRLMKFEGEEDETH